MKYLLELILVVTLVLPFSGCEAPDAADLAWSSGEITVVTPSVEAESPATARDTLAADGKSFIWEISSEGSFVYLLGSVHAGEPDMYPLADSIENAFKASDILVVEVNINEVSELKTALLMMKYGTYPEGESLRDNLPEDLYARLSERFEEGGISLAVMDVYRPWVIMTMTEVLAIQEAGYSEEYGIDIHFLNLAIDRGIEMIELETAEYQMQLLSGLSDELMIQILEMSLEEPLTVADLDLMFELWEDGDAAGLEELMFEGLVEEPALASYYDVLLTQRNYNMLEKIEAFLADDYICFVVVGAGHLVGEEGLLSLLEEKGYALEQLEN